MSNEDLKEDLAEGNSKNKTRQTTVRERMNDMVMNGYEKFTKGQKRKTFIMSNGENNDRQ